MPYSVRSITGAIVSILNGATAGSAWYLSTNLSSAVGDVIQGTPENAPKGIEGLPAVWVGLDSDTEDWAELGAGARRNMTVRVNIVAAVYAPPSPITKHDDAEAQMTYLCDNIKGILRSHVSLSQTVMSIRAIGTDYNVQLPGTQPQEYVSVGRVRCEARVLSV